MQGSENSRNKVDAARAGIVSRAAYWDPVLVDRCTAQSPIIIRAPLSYRRAKGLIADAAIATCLNASREGFGPANQP